MSGKIHYFKKMDILNIGNENANTVTVWVSHCMNKI